MIKAPKIEFPCDYPLWIIGEGVPQFQQQVLEIVREHVEQVHEASINVRESRGASYCSVRVTIVATGEAQLTRLHTALMAVPAVRMVL